jgi:VanZ family protein
MELKKRVRTLTLAARLALGPVIAAVVVLSLVPGLPPEMSAAGLDKLEHLAAYGAIGFLIVSAFARNGKRALLLAAAVAFCALLGLVLEWLQSYTGRTPDLLDELCDIAGGLAGGLLALFLARFWARSGGSN